MFSKSALLSQSSCAIQLVSLILIILLSILFMNIFGLAFAIPFWGTDLVKNVGNITNYEDPNTIGFLKYVQLINQLGLFIIPPILFAFLVHRKVMEYLKLNMGININQMLLGILLIFVSLPLISWLGMVNQKMVLPEFLSPIESWMKSKEATAMNLTKVFLKADSSLVIVINMFLIAVIPAVGEELFFRGLLIRFFKKWLGKIHWAVFISSFLFSALHLQFYGFLPRYALGLILAYTFVWSGSIWIPIILHFINNASVLAAFYITRSEDFISGKEEILVSQDNTIGIIFSVFLSVSILYYFFKHRQKSFSV